MINVQLQDLPFYLRTPQPDRTFNLSIPMQSFASAIVDLISWPTFEHYVNDMRALLKI